MVPIGYQVQQPVVIAANVHLLVEVLVLLVLLLQRISDESLVDSFFAQLKRQCQTKRREFEQFV